MKIAVIGTGKTGSEVLNLLGKEQIVGPFDEDHPVTVDKLQPADAAIIFVPGSAVDDIIDTVLAAGVAAAWGSTGYTWPRKKLNQKLVTKQLKWMHASNFSLGMQLVRRCIEGIGKGAELLGDPDFHIHEVHHVHKKDAPSGTALSWKEWLGREASISSERKGDVKGVHQLTMETPFESVELTHRAKDRAVFAKGAIWAAQQLLLPAVEPGFYSMKMLFDQSLSKQ